jgi:ubiquinone/menaquinone biosynthesis C-methylase UbiE
MVSSPQFDLNSIYSLLFKTHSDEFAILDRSLGPRSWEYIYELAAGLGIQHDSLLADAGCGTGKHCHELADRFGCRVIGFDLVSSSLRGADQPPSSDRVQLLEASIEDIPLRDASVDFVWCRDMLVHVPDLDIALCECSRILHPRGKMLLYTSLETELMEPHEAERLYRPLAIRPVRRYPLERSFASAGFRIAHAEEIGSEMMEFYEEVDGRASNRLMRIARMRRSKQQLVSEWGNQTYETLLALYNWMVYLMIGKLTASYYILEKA